MNMSTTVVRNLLSALMNVDTTKCDYELLGIKIGKIYTDDGFPPDMALEKLDISKQDKLLVVFGISQWLIDHKRNSGAGEAAIDRQRKANLRVLKTFNDNGEMGIY